MKSLTLAAALAAAALLPGSASAQVSAVIVIGRPPVVVERAPRYHDYSYRSYQVPPRRIYVERRYPRVIYVKRVHGHHRHHGYRAVRAYYDHRRDAYYDGYRDGLREVTLYRYGNDDQYYSYDNDQYDE